MCPIRSITVLKSHYKICPDWSQGTCISFPVRGSQGTFISFPVMGSQGTGSLFLSIFLTCLCSTAARRGGNSQA